MNLSYHWLQELVPFDLSPEALAAELTRVGCCVEELHPVGEDTMLVAEVTTNRPDWLCHWGVAHEIAAFAGLELRLPEIQLPEPGEARIEDLTGVVNEAEDLCPRYTARLIQGVRVAPSPAWLQARLNAVGIKPRNNVVDITNLILVEMNQPLHAFDFDRLADRRIVVRRARNGEPFVSVFDEERTLDAEMCVIADGEGPVALAGIKGGRGSAVTDGTANVLLEAAYFDPGSTRRASRRAQLDSDSSYRFERGIDPGGVERASARAAQLLCELAGGALAAGLIDTRPDLATPWEAEMRWSRAKDLLGIEVPRPRIESIFHGLGLETVEKTPAHITVRVPTFREDLTREADLIEEVARCHGYETIPTDLTMPVAAAHVSTFTQAERITVEVLVGLGYHECLTDTFVPEAWLDETAPLTPDVAGPVRVRNPVREDRPVMRRSLLPSLLEVRRVNRQTPCSLFELNRVFLPGTDGDHDEPVRLALLDDRGPEFLRGALERVLAEVRVDGDVDVRPVLDPLPGLEDTTVAELRVGETRLAVFGRIDPALAERHDLLAAPSAMEVDFTALAALPRMRRFFRPLPRFPAVERDIALVVPEPVRWAEIEAAVREQPDLVESVDFASVYRGKQIPAGKKSVAFAIRYRHPERSLTDEEANDLRDRMVQHLTGRIEDASLR